MIIVSSELAVAIEHVKEKCKMTRLKKYMDGEGNPKHPLIKRVLAELGKEEIIQVIFYGYEIIDK